MINHVRLRPSNLLVVIFLSFMAFLFLAPLGWMVSTSLDETANVELADPPRFLPWSSENAASFQKGAKLAAELGSGARVVKGKSDDLLAAGGSETPAVVMQLDPNASATVQLDLGQRHYISRLGIAAHVPKTEPGTAGECELSIDVSPDRIKAGQTLQISRDNGSTDTLDVIPDTDQRPDDLFNLTDLTVSLVSSATHFEPQIDVIDANGIPAKLTSSDIWSASAFCSSTFWG